MSILWTPRMQSFFISVVLLIVTAFDLSKFFGSPPRLTNMSNEHTEIWLPESIIHGTNLLDFPSLFMSRIQVTHASFKLSWQLITCCKFASFIILLPLPSQMPNLAWRALLSVSPVPRSPPVLLKLRALKSDQGLSSLTRCFQGRPGASKPDMDGHFGHFQISDIGFQILDIRFWMSDFRLQILNFGFQ